MEHVPNGSLFDFIKREKQLNLKLARHFAAELVLALEVLKSYQIVHRDLKPGNILLDKDYHIKLIDFATCKILDPAPVSYTHLRAHETGRNLVCRLLLEKKK